MEEHQGARKKPLKKMCKMTIKELEATSKSRESIGLKPLKIKIRSCILCQKDSESIEDRPCGCPKVSASRLTGFEVI